MSSLLRRFVPVLALAAGAAVIALHGGCNQSAPPGPATVRGAVAFQGQPLAGGMIVFSPDPDRGGSGKPIRGDLGPDGRFQLSSAGEKAIAPGWYRVAIAPAPPSDPASLAAHAAFPAKLARPDMSTVVREVKPGQENVFEFAVEVPIQNEEPRMDTDETRMKTKER